ncbi:MAG: peptidoglycan-binding domain-containing protein, partial [Candidatus Jorgensenbacteria bacterium]
MNKLTKRIATIGVVGVVALSMIGTSASAALTQAQIDAIVTMVQSFGADATTVANVRASLTGGTTTTGGTTVATACSFTKDLTLGSTGTDVQCLQQYLNSAGYSVASTGVGSAGNESTYFGSLTQTALAKWQAAMSVSPAAGYFGSISRAKYASVAGTTTGGTTTVPGVVVPGTGLAVSVASGNPAGTTIPKGGTGITYLKFNIAGTGTVQTLVVKRTGAGATTDFSSVYLYEGGTRLTSGRSVNSSSHEVTFTSLALAVNGVRTFSVVADMSATAAAADRNALQISSIVADSSVSVSGLPVSGNEMAVSGTAAGSVTLTKSGSIANPNIGQLAAQVSQFRITAATENVNVSRIALFSGGTISKSNLSNFVLKEYATGNTLATATGVNAKDLVVFELATPYQILKGENKTFSVYADIGGGAKVDDTIKLYIDETTDVFAIGQQYGQGVTVTRTDFDSTAADHHVLTLQGATVTITFNGPNTGDIRKNGKDLSLFDFNFASANNIEVRNLRFTITASTTGAGVDDLKVVDVDSGLVVAGPMDDASGAEVFTDVFNINAGQSRHLKLTGDTDTTYLNSETILAQLTAFAASDVKNLDNNQFLTVATEISPAGTVSGNTLTVQAPTLNVGLAGTPVSDVFIKGTTLVPFLGLSLQAIADDIKVTTIKLTSSGSSSTNPEDKDELTAIKLYDGTTQVGTVKSLTGTADDYKATFDNLTLLIPKGT